MSSSSSVRNWFLGAIVSASFACSSNTQSAPNGVGGSNPNAGAAGKSTASGAVTGQGGAQSGGVTAQNGGAQSGGAQNGGATAQNGGAQNGGAGAQATGGSAPQGAAGSAAASGGTATSAGASGGNLAAGGASAGSGGITNDPFVLAWQDEFDTLDSSAWQLENFTYDGNQAQFSPQNASVANGVLSIALTPAPSGSAKPYLGVEMRSAKTLTYGKVSARMRFATGSGVVSGLVLFYTPFPNCDWNEIDIEHLGAVATSSQLNAQVFLGAVVPNCTTSVSPTQDPLITPLGFNAEADFHLYDIVWTPSSIQYFADGVLLRTWTANIARMKLPQTILLTIWASSAASWAGALNGMSAPTSAQVDWIKVYSWNG